VRSAPLAAWARADLRVDERVVDAEEEVLRHALAGLQLDAEVPRLVGVLERDDRLRPSEDDALDPRERDLDASKFQGFKVSRFEFLGFGFRGFAVSRLPARRATRNLLTSYRVTGEPSNHATVQL
jgi:hypothetical protein